MGILIVVVISTLLITSLSISNYGYFDINKVVYGQPDPNQRILILRIRQIRKISVAFKINWAISFGYGTIDR
jgi:hypothetical protein